MQPEDGSLSQTFPKVERISSCLAIEQLVNARNAVYKYPIKCYYAVNQLSDTSPVSRMAVSVPKRLFKHAVDRNRIKRLVREAYRLNKGRCLQTLAASGRQADMLFLFMGKEMPQFTQIEDVIKQLLSQIAKQS